MKSLALVSVVAVGLLAGAGGASGTPAAATQHSIVVSGSGAVASVPDRAQISFGVSSDGKTASAALHANGAEMTRVIAAVKGEGIAAADIKTEVVSLSARYSQNGEAIIGYTATNSVSGIIRVLGKVGAVIDAAVEAGANQVFGPNLSLSDQTALYRQALRTAITNAKGKAQTIARASGLTLRRITDVSESGGPTPIAKSAQVGIAPATPIEAGTQFVQATVTVTFSVA